MSNPSHAAPPATTYAFDLSKAPIINPEEIRPVYSNNAAVLMTPHDLRIVFTEVVLSGPTATQPTIELRASVSLAPTQFKAFAAAVAQSLQGYEKQFGEISWPPKNQ